MFLFLRWYIMQNICKVLLSCIFMTLLTTWGDKCLTWKTIDNVFFSAITFSSKPPSCYKSPFVTVSIFFNLKEIIGSTRKSHLENLFFKKYYLTTISLGLLIPTSSCSAWCTTIFRYKPMFLMAKSYPLHLLEYCVFSWELVSFF